MSLSDGVSGERDSVQQKFTADGEHQTEQVGRSVSEPITIRKNEDGQTVDEIVAQNCSFHIEQMDATGFWFSVNKSHFYVGARNARSHVDLTITDLDNADTRTPDSSESPPPGILAEPISPDKLRVEALVWLEQNNDCELSFYGCGCEEWQVYRLIGSHCDRELKLIGSGTTPAEAIARAALNGRTGV